MATGNLRKLDWLESRVGTIRGEQVMLDSDLAETYGVPTRVLNQAVRRNPGRFPEDFAFRVSPAELAALRSQIVISKPGRGGRRSRPLVFTEHGAIMAATVLNSPRAAEMSIFVVRVFVRLRAAARTHAALAAKIDELERKVAGHDENLKSMFAALRALVARPTSPRRSIGFKNT